LAEKSSNNPKIIIKSAIFKANIGNKIVVLTLASPQKLSNWDFISIHGVQDIDGNILNVVEANTKLDIRVPKVSGLVVLEHIKKTNPSYAYNNANRSWRWAYQAYYDNKSLELTLSEFIL